MKLCSDTVSPIFCCFQVQNAENNASSPQSFRYFNNLSGDDIYMVNTKKIYNIWNAIIRAPVYQALILRPSPHVLFKISMVQYVHQLRIPSNIIFNDLSKFGLCLVSIIAIINRSICSNSFGNDIGTGSGMSFICKK